MRKKKPFFDAIENVTKGCQYHLEEEFGPDMASCLNSLFYYR